MTSAHALYIPTIFLLGLVLGLLIQRTPPSREQTVPQKKVPGVLVLSTFIVFLIAFIGTHFFEMPRSSKSVVKALNGQEIFDKKPVYSSEEVYERIALCPHQGLELYKEFTYTIDVLFPLTLLVFLLSLSAHASETAGIKSMIKPLTLALPSLWFVTDMVENAIIYRLLSLFPAKDIVLAGAIGYITLTKFALLLSSILSSVLLLVLKVTKKKAS